MLHLEISVKRRHIYALVAAVALVVTILPVASWASHQFTDVPDSNIFHNDIAWLADNGVTLGCNPPANDKFCPGDVVDRQAMAAFLHRLAVNKVVDAKTAVQADNADKLDGKNSTDFLAANEAPVITGDTITFAATPVTGVTKIEEVSVTTASDGYLFISANSVWSSSATNVLTWVQLDSTTCSNFVGSVTSIGYGYVLTAAQTWSSVSFGGTIAASAGAHTVTLCANPFSGNLTPNLRGAGVQALYVADGSVTANLAGSSSADNLAGTSG
jgi:hypothetical protein